MSVGFATARTWHPGPLTESSVRLAAATEQLRDVREALASAALETGQWDGPAAAQARSRHDALVRRAEHLAKAVTAVQAMVHTGAGRVSTVQELVSSAVALAEAQGVLLTDAGQLLDLTSAPTALHPDLEVLVGRATAEATLADDALAAALATIPREEMATPASPPALALLAEGHGVGWAGLAGSDALGWWCNLSAEERQSAVVQDPDRVGTTDGVPSWARDQANRIRLRQAEQDLAYEAERLRPSPASDLLGSLRDAGVGGLTGAATVGTLDGPTRRAAYLQVQAKLAAVRTTEQVLESRDAPPRQLLVFDVTGRSAKVAVGLGDVDRAGHVAVVVPGFTTTVQRDLPGAVQVGADLADVARRESMGWGDRGDVAVVAWLGYDAPQVADTLRAHSVVRRESAEAGAASLARFLRGLPSPAHLTLVGHSYGSTTAGLAVAGGGTGVDDLVALGSPGLGVASVAQLPLRPDRVHVLEADADPVADLGWFGRDPGHLDGVDHLSTAAAVLTDGSSGAPSLGHSGYLTPGTTSQWNVAAVVAGVPTVSRRPPGSS